MTRIAFREVSLHASKRGICPICGKRAERKSKFWQTMSPFNKNGNGIPKSSDEILAELRIERGIWLTADVKHSHCDEVAL